MESITIPATILFLAPATPSEITQILSAALQGKVGVTPGSGPLRVIWTFAVRPLVRSREYDGQLPGQPFALTILSIPSWAPARAASRASEASRSLKEEFTTRVEMMTPAIEIARMIEETTKTTESAAAPPF